MYLQVTTPEYKVKLCSHINLSWSKPSKYIVFMNYRKSSFCIVDINGIFQWWKLNKNYYCQSQNLLGLTTLEKVKRNFDVILFLYKDNVEFIFHWIKRVSNYRLIIRIVSCDRSLVMYALLKLYIERCRN